MILLGRIGKVYGLRGWVVVYSETQPSKNILEYTPWTLYRSHLAFKENVILKTLTPAETRIVSDRIQVRFPNVNTCEAAQDYVNALIAIEKQQLPSLPDNEYYWADLEGLSVITLTGTLLGTVEHLIETGANDVLVVTAPLTKKQYFIPYLPGMTIKEVDLNTRRIIVDWDIQ